MATFKYEALTETDRLMTGTIEAGTPDEASQLLQSMRLRVNSVEKARPEKSKTAIGRNEFLLFNQQLASITKTGIPMERALRELSNDITSRKMRRLINQIADDLESGTNIVDAFEKHSKSFPHLYGRILKAGIETGRLSEMLTSLNRNLEVAGQTRRIIFEAIAYPIVVLAIACIIITGVLLFVVPTFEVVLYEMAGGALNPMTTLFFTISHNVVSVWLMFAAVIGGIVLLFLWLSSFSAGRRFKESIYLKLPVFGSLYHSSTLAKMSESMAMLVAAGTDMPAVLRLGGSASGSEKLMLESEILAGQVESGSSMIEAGQFCRMIPRLFMYSIQLAQQRDELQDSLHGLSRMYCEQVRCWQMRLQGVMLPIMLIFTGGFLFLCVTSMFLPMMQVITCLGSG